MKSTQLTRSEIREKGLKALMKSLGPDGMIRFIQEYEAGKGDYTLERHQWLDTYSIDEIHSEIARMKNKNSGKKTKSG